MAASLRFGRASASPPASNSVAYITFLRFCQQVAENSFLPCFFNWLLGAFVESLLGLVAVSRLLSFAKFSVSPLGPDTLVYHRHPVVFAIIFLLGDTLDTLVYHF